MKIGYAVTFVLGVVFVTLGVLTAVLFDSIINPVIYKNLVLKNGTEMYKMWVDPPIVPHIKWYFFNVTNSVEFLKFGVKPILKEMGPYTYREKWHRDNIKFFPNDTVNFQTKRQYFFERSLSVGAESDLIHTLNVPVIVAADLVKHSGRWTQMGLSNVMLFLNESAFVTKTVKQLLWGYDDKLLDLAKKFLPAKVPFKKFGFFYNKNGSLDGLLNIHTGNISDGMVNYTIIDSYNHMSHLTFWSSDTCNRIGGTDGTSFPPGITKQSVLELFNINLCRTMPLVYHSNVEHFRIKGYRFVPPSNVFGNVSTNPQNKCFCIGGPPCIGGGVFNISACQMGSPSLISWPHFYQAEQRYLDAVVGLKPNAKKHSLFIDVSPRTGAPLNAQARVQINFATTKLAHVKAVSNMTAMVFPVVWFEDGVTHLPNEIVDLLRMAANVPNLVKTSVIVISTILGVGFILIALILFERNRHTQAYGTLHEEEPHASGEVNPVLSTEDPDSDE